MPFFFPRGKETLFEAISAIRKQNQEMDQLEPLVSTACRIRPAEKTEKREKRVLQCKPAMRLKNQKIRCDFDDVNNEEAFQKRVCDQVLEGQNTTLIAYGQTGSGKTYAILGEPDLHGPPRGLLARCVEYCANQTGVSIAAAEVFGTNLGEIKTFDVSGENATDLLDINALSFTSVSSVEEAAEFLSRVQKNLHLFSTAKSAKSSRGHTIYQIKANGTLTIVDLAGSDADSGFTSDFETYTAQNIVTQRKLETVVTNDGLSAMMNLLDHIMVKDTLEKTKLYGANTELTRVLIPIIQECSRVEIIYFFAPGMRDVNSSINTLRFAASCVDKAQLRDAETRRAMVYKTEEEVKKLEDERNALWNRNLELQKELSEAKHEKAKAETTIELLKVKKGEMISDILYVKKRNEVLKKQIAEQLLKKVNAIEKADELEEMHKCDVMKMKELKLEEEKLTNHFNYVESQLKKDVDDVQARVDAQEKITSKKRDVSIDFEKENNMLSKTMCACLTYSIPQKMKDHMDYLDEEDKRYEEEESKKKKKEKKRKKSQE